MANETSITLKEVDAGGAMPIVFLDTELTRRCPEPGNTRWATQSQQTKNSRPRTASQRDDETGRWVSA